MKNFKTTLLFATILLAFAACNKVGNLPFYDTGTATVLTASSSTIAPPPSDSLNTVLTLSWTNPNHATDSASYKYVIEIDTAGRNFAKSTSITVTGTRSKSFTGKELNAILVNYGYAFNVPVNMDVRVTSSYANNNDKLVSNTVRLKITPYKIPPKIALPTTGKLFIVGDATVGGWNNPVPVPSQEFARIDETTWGGIFQLNAGKQYLLLPLNGDWTNKFSVANNTVGGLSGGGDFGLNLSDNFPGPATAGMYKIIVDFQTGKFTVTPYTGPQLPTNLYIVGDATVGGWNNPVPVPTQQLTRLNSSIWELTLPLTGGKEFLLLPLNGDWGHKYAVADNSIAGLWQGGSFGYDLSKNFPGPPTSGTYKLTVNFLTGKFTVQ